MTPSDIPSNIPLNIDDVDPEWMSNLLGHHVADLTVRQIGQGVGIMGDIYRVGLQYEKQAAEAPSSLVVKLPSSFEENRTQGVALGMFEAEVRFYNELADQVAVGLPKVYRADIVSGAADFVIVMEDLSDLQMVDQAVGMTADQAMTAVNILAHVHAVWWDRAKDETMDWIPSMVGPRIEFVDQALGEMLPVFLDAFENALPDGGRELYERFTGNYLKVNRVVADRSPWTLVHQDFRVENLLFGEAGSDRMVVLDWQGIGRGPGAYDLGYLLGGSMAPELRREHESRLLAAYHNQLSTLGVTDYSAQQLAEDYAIAHLQGGLATAMFVGGGMDLSNERGRELAATMASRHATAALDHDGLTRLDDIVGQS
ncbi:MAG: DUF1679 domain-containing protein [Pseudomonadales bacterium]|nr:DUF1679 domain-containing protein [Pseudomonadales bacterium]